MDAAGILNEDVEGCSPAARGQFQVPLPEATIERADQLAVDIDLRIIVKAVNGEFTARTCCELRAVENVAVGLIEILHGEKAAGLDRLGQTLPERDGFDAGIDRVGAGRN